MTSVRLLIALFNVELMTLRTTQSYEGEFQVRFLWISFIFRFYFLCSVAHHIFGVAHTINSANYVYFLGLEKAMTLEHPEVTKLFTSECCLLRVTFDLVLCIFRASVGAAPRSGDGYPLEGHLLLSKWRRVQRYGHQEWVIHSWLQCLNHVLFRNWWSVRISCKIDAVIQSKSEVFERVVLRNSF